MDPRRRPSLLLWVVLLLAVVVGVVSVVLVGSSPTPPTPHAGEIIINFPPEVWGLLFLSPLLVGLAAIALQHIAKRTRRVPRQVVVAFVVVFGLLLVFVFILSNTPGTSTGSVSVVTPPPSNSTGASHANNTSSGGGSGSGATPAPAVSFPVPSWVLLVLVAGLTVIVGGLAIPGMLGRVLDRRRVSGGRTSRTPIDPLQVQAVLAQASEAIAQGADPRQTIIQLYVRLLNEFGPKLGAVDYMTAEEIRGDPLARLRVRPSAAEALTRLFEQARYSSHPMGPEDASRCLDALRQVESDLARGAPAA